MLRTDRLIELRKQRGLIQNDVASEIGLERTTYVRYENGGIRPPTDMVIKLADYFNVAIDYLLGKGDDPTPQANKKPAVIGELTKEEVNAIKYLRTLSPDARDAMISGLRAAAEDLRKKRTLAKEQ